MILKVMDERKRPSMKSEQSEKQAKETDLETQRQGKMFEEEKAQGLSVSA